MLPALASTMVAPGSMRPRRSASTIIASAARSFTLPPGAKNSSFASTSACPAGTTRRRRTSGVRPIALSTSSWITGTTGQRTSRAERMREARAHWPGTRRTASPTSPLMRTPAGHGVPVRSGFLRIGHPAAAFRDAARPAPTQPARSYGLAVRIPCRRHVARPLHPAENRISPRLVQRIGTSKERKIVIDKLGFLVRFWELKARHATLGQPLAASEQLELLSLMQLVTGDFKMPEPGTCARPANALPAQLIGEGTILPVEVRYVCAAAMLVASAQADVAGRARHRPHRRRRERRGVRVPLLRGVGLRREPRASWRSSSTASRRAASSPRCPSRARRNVLSIGRKVRLVG